MGIFEQQVLIVHESFHF